MKTTTNIPTIPTSILPGITKPTPKPRDMDWVYYSAIVVGSVLLLLLFPLGAVIRKKCKERRRRERSKSAHSTIGRRHYDAEAPPDGPYYIYEEGREASKGSTMSASTDITPISENISTLPRSDYDDQGSVAGRINYGYGLGIPPPSIAESPLTPRRLDLDQVSLASSSISHSGARKGSGAFMGFDENGRPVTYGQMMEGKRRMRTNSDGAGSYRSYDNKGFDGSHMDIRNIPAHILYSREYTDNRHVRPKKELKRERSNSLPSQLIADEPELKQLVTHHQRSRSSPVDLSVPHFASQHHQILPVVEENGDDIRRSYSSADGSNFISSDLAHEISQNDSDDGGEGESVYQVPKHLLDSEEGEKIESEGNESEEDHYQVPKYMLDDQSNDNLESETDSRGSQSESSEKDHVYEVPKYMTEKGQSEEDGQEQGEEVDSDDEPPYEVPKFLQNCSENDDAFFEGKVDNACAIDASEEPPAEPACEQSKQSLEIREQSVDIPEHSHVDSSATKYSTNVPEPPHLTSPVEKHANKMPVLSNSPIEQKEESNIPETNQIEASVPTKTANRPKSTELSNPLKRDNILDTSNEKNMMPPKSVRHRNVLDKLPSLPLNSKDEKANQNPLLPAKRNVYRQRSNSAPINNTNSKKEETIDIADDCEMSPKVPSKHKVYRQRSKSLPTGEIDSTFSDCQNETMAKKKKTTQGSPVNGSDKRASTVSEKELPPTVPTKLNVYRQRSNSLLTHENTSALHEPQNQIIQRPSSTSEGFPQDNEEDIPKKSKKGYVMPRVPTKHKTYR